MSLYYKAVLLVEESFPNPPENGGLRLRLRICKTDAYVLLPKRKIPDAEGTVCCRFPAPGFLFLNVIFPDSAACAVPLPVGFPPEG